MKYINPVLKLSLTAILLAALAGCGGGENPDGTQAAAPAEPATEPNRLEQTFLDESPAGVVDLQAVLESAQPGDSVVVRGRIGGMGRPFTEGYAAFVLADEALTFCDEMSAKDHCPMPWDACCEDPEKRKSLRASVQVVDAEGMPIAQGLKGIGELSENDTVVVAGVVDAASSPGNMIINATGIFRM